MSEPGWIGDIDLSRFAPSYGEILTRAFDAIIVIDESSRIVGFNQGAEQVFGQRRDDVLGKSLDLLIPVQYLEQHKARVAQFLKSTGSLKPMSGGLRAVKGIRRDGSEFQLEAIIVKTDVDDQRPRQLAVFMRDITQRQYIERALEASERHFASLLKASPVGVFETDAEGRCTFVNERWCQMTGLNAYRNLGQGWLRAVHQEERDAVADAWQQAVKHRQPFNREIRFKAADGRITWVYAQAVIMEDFDNQHLGYMGSITDISERKVAEQALRQSEEEYRRIVETTQEGVWVIDDKNITTLVNNRMAQMLGYSRDEMVGMSLFDFMDEEGKAITSSNVERRRAGIAEQHEFKFLSKDGAEVWTQVATDPYFDGAGNYTGALAMVTDITERKANEARIEYLAHHDSLTGLPNRVLLRDRVIHAIADAEREQTKVAIMFLDLDHFKLVNDSLGHLMGDKLLLAVSERLRRCMRESDTVCRLGGDEFVVLVPHVHDAFPLESLPEKILSRLAESFEIDAHVLNTSFSIGISLYPNDGRDFETLLSKADTALYHAKQSGRNMYRFFTHAMNVQVMERLALENGLRQALKNGDLKLYYQPQCNLLTGKIIGAEALLRWPNPQRGFVSPKQIIPIAEDSGLILDIGEWVMRKACEQAQAWQASGVDEISVAVNLSGLQFKRGNLVEVVNRVIRQSGIRPDRLELEITESILIHESEGVVETVHRLKALGVRLSMDDFGTGYSSLGYLKRFALDKLKIDQSFINGLPSDPHSVAIVRAIIQMCRSLHLKTVAEGVENDGQYAVLSNYGCDAVQGYYVSRPLPSNEFLDLLKNNSRVAIGSRRGRLALS